MTVPISPVAVADSIVIATVRADYGVGEPWAGTLQEVGTATLTVMPDRLAGANRVATAVTASEAAFDNASSVVIATGYDFPDALSASALGGAVDGPLLLVARTSVPAAVLDEIKRLGASKAYIVGGTGVVGPEVAAALTSTGLSVERVAGSTRYGTAKAVADEVVSISGKPSTVFLATGLNFPDALAASSMAARMKAPILLTRTDILPPETAAALSSIRPSEVVVCGGTGAVGNPVRALVEGNPTFGSPTLVETSGATRYDTAKLLIDWAISQSGGDLAPDRVDGIFLATGASYPDALAGGVLAGAGGPQWRPLMLTSPTSLVSQAEAIITENDRIGFVTAVGGTGALSEDVLQEALQLLP